MVDAPKTGDFNKAVYQLVMITWNQFGESRFKFLIESFGQFAFGRTFERVRVSRKAVEQFVCKQSGSAVKGPKSASKIWR